MKGLLSFYESNDVSKLREIWLTPTDKQEETITIISTTEGTSFHLRWSKSSFAWKLKNQDTPDLHLDSTPVHSQEITLKNQQILATKTQTWRFETLPDPPQVNGRPTFSIRLRTPLLFGQFDKNEDTIAVKGSKSASVITKVILDDRTISRKRAILKKNDHGEWVLEKIPGGTGLLTVNGKESFEVSSPLVYGDRIQIGPYPFEFRVTALALLNPFTGVEVVAQNAGVEIEKRPILGRGPIKRKTLLQRFSFTIGRGSFVGIIGGSGMGKSTLMNALSGLAPATHGKILGNDHLIDSPSALIRNSVGIVPQDDIVHRELTGWEAVLYSIRLQIKLPRKQAESLTEELLDNLGLDEHAKTPIEKMSGGQRKRVSIATVLLARPSLLFLDEPTSGLDPKSEKEVMEILASLSRSSNCTVVCTTHMLDNAAKFDKLLVVHDGRLVFFGTNQEARLHFLKQDETKLTPGEILQPLANIYHRLGVPADEGGKSPDTWEEEFQEVRRDLDEAAPPPPKPRKCAPRSQRPSYLSNIWTLLCRQWSIFKFSKLNIAFLIFQAVGIGFLLGWVSNDGGFRLFLTIIASMWFGCSNSGQRIVSELKVFRQERVAGLGIHTYIQSKFLFLSITTMAQALLLFLCMTLASVCFHPTEMSQEELTQRLVERENTTPGVKLAGKTLDLSEKEQFRSKLISIAENAGAPTPAQRTPPPLQIPSQFMVWVARSLGIEYNLLLSQPSAAQNFKPQIKKSETLLDSLDPSNPTTTMHLLPMMEGLLSNDKTAWTEKLRTLPDEKLTLFRHTNNQPYLLRGEPWQKVFWTTLKLRLLALLGASIAGVCLGLGLSALVKTEVHAVLWVPILLIPQILLGAFVITQPEMGPIARKAASLTPSFSAQKLSELSQIYGQRTPEMINEVKIPSFMHPEGKHETVPLTRYLIESEFPRTSPNNQAWQNLTVKHALAGQHKIQTEQTSTPGVVGPKLQTVLQRDDVLSKRRDLFLDLGPCRKAVQSLLTWLVLSYLIILMALHRKQTERL